MSKRKKKEKFNINEFLKCNNAIFNYIYDNRGLKRGIVLATRTPLKGKCKIGWALFDEYDKNHELKCKTLSKLRDIPVIMEKINDIKDIAYELSHSEELQGIRENRNLFISIMQDARYLEDVSLNSTEEYFYLDNASDMEKLFKSALERANHDSWNYYCAKGTTLSKSDLRSDYIKIESSYNEGNKEVVRYFTSKDSNLCNSIRKAIRKIEHRAWKYFR